MDAAGGRKEAAGLGPATFPYDLRLLFSVEEFPILRDEVPPLGRDGEHVEDGVDRACRLAVGATDASFGVDEEHFGLGGERNAVNRTNIDTRAILDPNTGLGNHEWHGAPLVGEARCRVTSTFVSRGQPGFGISS